MYLQKYTAIKNTFIQSTRSYYHNTINRKALRWVTPLVPFSFTHFITKNLSRNISSLYKTGWIKPLTLFTSFKYRKSYVKRTGPIRILSSIKYNTCKLSDYTSTEKRSCCSAAVYASATLHDCHFHARDRTTTATTILYTIILPRARYAVVHKGFKNPIKVFFFVKMFSKLKKKNDKHCEKSPLDTSQYHWSSRIVYIMICSSNR